MPEPMVADEFASGALVRLEVPEIAGTEYALAALWRKDSRPGPAACWTLDAFEAALARCPG
jgi:DNA-binding transcriptional LysR family regulator